MALDEASTALLTQLGESGLPPISDMTPEQARGLGPALAEMYGPGPDVELVAEPPDAPVPVRVIVPAGTPRGVVVYYHGGGWVIGALDEFENLGRTLAVRTGCVVVLVDYRLAPEHRYPTAVEDAWTALRWVDEQVETLAGARVPIVVAGDSAGGNLAAIVARRARDAGGPALAAQVLVYPVTDANVDRPSYVDPDNQLIVSRAAMIWFWGHYAPDPSLRGQPDASPLRADDLGGLPPAAVLLAEHDPLRDEGQAYADRLAEAGTGVSTLLVPGQMHGFFTLLMLPGAAVGMDFVVDEIAKALASR
ncbi:putative lipase/esterase [Actinomycetospora sp. NBRC 106375]|uniref:alpha/beta hydrolase n=1 Tax=Actinomycetospora sp. NBRC 106375 TaxID=3032207 RepID=UPI0024A2309F|nr:alpha/beta hydrolase [Actinomycetospora sp. NBRC 106375]GLZ45380.1 putative lipase/esterase [Actinomycetospora sp. NBRC 106375]